MKSDKMCTLARVLTIVGGVALAAGASALLIFLPPLGLIGSAVLFYGILAGTPLAIVGMMSLINAIFTNKYDASVFLQSASRALMDGLRYAGEFAKRYEEPGSAENNKSLAQKDVKELIAHLDHFLLGTVQYGDGETVDPSLLQEKCKDPAIAFLLQLREFIVNADRRANLSGVQVVMLLATLAETLDPCRAALDIADIPGAQQGIRQFTMGYVRTEIDAVLQKITGESYMRPNL
ncbi:MAG: hypothetical protein LBF24_03855 [Puniceicoccales bacterium]|nr:hypothetical protein [Puniceicoccales bacterium]